MNAKVKTITKKAVIVIAGSLGLMLLFFALLIGLVCCIAVDKAPSSRELCKRMNDYYGERFTKVSQEELGGEHSVMYYTFRDSSGLECHVVCGRVELTPGKWIYSVLDDYSVSRIAQTPAVQRLLAQSAFKVQDTSGFENGDLSELDQCFSYPIPDKRLCSYVISVDNYADIADALQLAADTVNAADSRVSFRRDESEQGNAGVIRYEWSILPEIQVGEDALAEFAFGADSEQPVTDELLNQAQYQFCVYAEQNGKLDTLPEEAILLYAPTAQYRMQFGDETVFMQLPWDNELKMYRLGSNSQYRTPIFTLMKLLGMEPSWSASEDRFHIESGEDDAEREPELVVDGEMRYGISEIRYKGERYAGTRSFGYEPTEADLREILHIRLEVDPLTKTGTIYQE